MQTRKITMEYNKGYIALVTVLIISGVALAIAATVSLLGIGVAQSALSGSKGENALQLAEGCMEDALLNSQQSSSYSGGNITRPEGTCVISIQKSGNNWTITATSTQTDYNKTVVANFVRTAGSPITTTWQESLPVATPIPPSGPPVFDASAASTRGACSASCSWSQTIGNNANRIILVGVGSTTTPTSVMYGGTALTMINQDCGTSCTSLWYLVNPPVGTATVSISGGSGVTGGGSLSLYNVNQQTPVNNHLESTQFGITLIMNVPNSSATTMVIDADYFPASGGVVPNATTTGMTQWFNSGSSFNNTTAMGSYKIGTNTTTMSWTSGTSANWFGAAAVIN